MRRDSRAAFSRLGRDVATTFVPSDLDTVFTSYDWLRALLLDSGACVSYSENGAKGNPWIESFWARFKQENHSLVLEAATLAELGRLVDQQMRYYNREHGLPDVSDFLRDLNEARKSEAYGDVVAAVLGENGVYPASRPELPGQLSEIGQVDLAARLQDASGRRPWAFFAASPADGREISVPLEWYPRLLRATPVQRENWRLIGKGSGIHWPDVDEDISTIGRLEGWPSAEYERAPT